MKTVKATSLALVLCLFVTLCFPAAAEINAPTGTFSSNYFASYGVAISDNGGHQLHIVFSTVGMGLCDEIGVATFGVEKYIETEQGNFWTNISGSCPGQTGHNTASYSYSLNFQCASGGTYRVRVTFVCVKTFPDGHTGMEHKSVTTGGYTIQ